MIDHRLTLHRFDAPNSAYLLWVLLNPSTADDMKDDPTIRRVRAFSLREGFASFRVVNLFTVRATRPSELFRVPLAERNHARADEVLVHEARHAAHVMVGWGVHGDRCHERVQRVHELLHHRAGQTLLHCLGTTQAGHPRHPLYARADAEIVVWGAS